LQAEVERRGTQIFDLVDRHPESIFSKAGFYQRMMEFSMRDEHFKVQMFRFVDVLASLRRGSDIVATSRRIFCRHAQWLRPAYPHRVSLARIVPIISGKFLRWNVSGMARQFIAGRNPA
jgi:RHH-type proline utilization regulon transcriptional repressor/proline dehydrogenase/delta 1-pyrroline-5-carboxylate dehydrogenase